MKLTNDSFFSCPRSLKEACLTMKRTFLPCPHPIAYMGLNFPLNSLLHLQLLHFQLLPSPLCLLLSALNLFIAATDLALPLLLHPLPLPLYSSQSYTSLPLGRTGKTGNNCYPSWSCQDSMSFFQVLSLSKLCQYSFYH